MFDARSEVWIKILKCIIVAFFFIILLVGIIVGISDLSMYGGFDIIADDGLGDLIIDVLIFGIVAFLELSSGMLVVNFFTNVQDIREQICED